MMSTTVHRPREAGRGGSSPARPHEARETADRRLSVLGRVVRDAPGAGARVVGRVTIEDPGPGTRAHGPVVREEPDPGATVLGRVTRDGAHHG